MRQNSSITAYNYQKNENFRYAKHLLDKEYDNPQKIATLTVLLCILYPVVDLVFEEQHLFINVIKSFFILFLKGD